MNPPERFDKAVPKLDEAIPSGVIPNKNRLILEMFTGGHSRISINRSLYLTNGVFIVRYYPNNVVVRTLGQKFLNENRRITSSINSFKPTPQSLNGKKLENFPQDSKSCRHRVWLIRRNKKKRLAL